MLLKPEIVEEVRKKASIVQVIGHYIPLIKKGRGYTALCPFHDDHDPSLSISEEKQIFKCFVCGVGGNVFSFVMHYTHCSFPEAVKAVAEISGLHLDIAWQKPQQTVSKYQKLYDIFNESIKFTNYLLNTPKGHDALSYLNKRGLNKEIIDYFEIGYNPRGDVLYHYLHEKNYRDEDIVVTNICRQSDYGLKDVFYDRLLFPIHDPAGQPIAFTARSIVSDNPVKYINTATTALYTKGNVVYNFHRALPAIRKAKRVLITEGVMDVIAFKRAGIENAVATLGTACTPWQLQLLAKACNHLVFCYDGDKAGRAATMKALTMLLERGVSAYTIVNRTKLDPDEILANGEAKDLRDFAAQEITAIEYALDYYQTLYPLNSYSNRKRFQSVLSSLIAYLKDEYDQANYYLTLQQLTGLTARERKIDQPQLTKVTKVVNRPLLDGVTKAEFMILNQMMLSAKAVEIYRRDLGCLLDEENDLLAAMISEEYHRCGNFNFSDFFDRLTNEALKSILLDIATVDFLQDRYDEEIMIGAVKKIQRALKQAELKQLKQEILKYEHLNAAKTKELLQRYSKLVEELGGKR